MKSLIRNLTFWVLLSILLGILVGYWWPERGVQMEVLSKGFINLIKLFIYPIIFLTITLGIAGMGNLKKVGRIGGKALFYFEIVTTLALLIGIVVAHYIKPGVGVDISGIKRQSVEVYAQRAQAFNWLHFFQDNLTIQFLFISLLIGVLIGKVKKLQQCIPFIETISKWVFKLLHYVMYLAPVGAFGGMAFTIGKFGLKTLLPLGKLMLSVYITMAVFVFVVLGLVLYTCRINIFQFLNYIKNEILLVLGTSSSEAALPSMMRKLESMGCEKSVVGLVIPAGYSFNLDGTTIYLSMSILFLAQVFNIHLTGEQIVYLIGVLMITSKGAAGVTGSGFVVLASTLTALKVIPIEGLALLFGVDRFMSEARAITNLIGNGVATIFLSHWEGMLDRIKVEVAFSKKNTGTV
jgi:aerobic C4-dicarboxylate transport protein